MPETGYKKLMHAVGQLLADVESGLIPASLAAKCLSDLHTQAKQEIQQRLELPVAELKLSSDATRMCKAAGLALVGHIVSLELDTFLKLNASHTVKQEVLEKLKLLHLHPGMNLSA